MTTVATMAAAAATGTTKAAAWTSSHLFAGESGLENSTEANLNDSTVVQHGFSPEFT